LDDARTAAAGAKAAVDSARHGLDQNIRRHNAAKVELTGRCEALAESVQERVVISADKPIEEQVQAAWQLAASARRRHDAARQARDDAARTAQERERKEDRLRASLKQFSELHGQQQERIDEITRQIAEIDEEVRRITPAPDPEAERAALDSRRSTLEKALKECQDADRRTATELAAAAARLEAREGARTTALEDARGAGEAARTAAVDKGFHDEVAAAEAELARIMREGWRV
jgi:chromosome segregation ATPase